jgi:hypothetical protein
MTDEYGRCPSCNADLNGSMIWDYFYNEFITNGDWLDENGKYTENSRILSHEDAEARADEVASNYGATRTKGRWGRLIGIYDDVKDRTVAWRCPDCNHEWPR